jgi:hypothetical protein
MIGDSTGTFEQAKSPSAQYEKAEYVFQDFKRCYMTTVDVIG